ncbi:ECF transporter S component [Lachnoclostridium phytofermentans]|uniref:ECF transporter S component n=1 Tax=Lachnoclostridium phytofermentans (strain ATCC 700394 / DSM 18823 / ISDg) TaxID=357809 RepID=A9KLD5_LACP7|nr:ECF transporter S component [Lachnoclostridium phytofermentans]ABX41264.1 hypothetical protein Cphy_0878 [Lachnoclostridium phytofermentans ISDg]
MSSIKTMNQKNVESNLNQSRPITLIIGAILTIASVVAILYGYFSKETTEVSSTDKLLIFGLIALLFGIVILVNGAFQLRKPAITATKSSMNVITLAQAALFAALAYIGFSYFRIDIPVGPGSTAFHFGNAFVVVAALLLGGSWGGLAGAVGLSLADLMSGKYFTVAPQTFFLKLCIGLIAGFVAHQIFHISTLNKKSKILTASIVASVAGLGFNVIADPIVGYFYKKIILGVQGDLAINWAKMTAVTTFVNAVTSAIMAVLLYNALRPALISAHMFLRKETKKASK